ncbi:DUF3299 domain-containing protein [Dyella silvatica]|uniref:DUF3299 domain-containing protein n=1 Tax=Dyella silvatica TaxID=2992128 RepID=UPI00225B5389|nr:DUF3299 domain-containing protein [Dyella silvatica]
MKMPRYLWGMGLLLSAATMMACSHRDSSDQMPASSASTAQQGLTRAQAAADAGRARAAMEGILAAQGLNVSQGKPPVKPGAAEEDALPLPDNDGYAELEWDDMLPKQDYEILQHEPPVVHIGNQRSKQLGTLHTVSGLAGRKVKLVGYVVPLETDSHGRMTEFFFVPFYGACIHVPPPPPNMIVHVVLAQAIETPSLWDPLWLKGTLRIETTENSMASSAYAMQSARLETYSDDTQQNLRRAFE